MYMHCRTWKGVVYKTEGNVSNGVENAQTCSLEGFAKMIGPSGL